MVDVKPETLKPDIADGIHVKFRRYSHNFASNNIVGRRGGWTIKDVGLESEVDMK